MNTKINQFCKKYLEKLKNDKDIAATEVDLFKDYRERINFCITEYSKTPNCHYLGTYSGSNLFFLDEDDLKYLYEKYSKKLQDEMNKNIEQVKQMYGQS